MALLPDLELFNQGDLSQRGLPGLFKAMLPEHLVYLPEGDLSDMGRYSLLGILTTDR